MDPPRRAASRQQQDAVVEFADGLHRSVLRPLWGFRFELFLIGVLAGGHAALAEEIGAAPAAVVLASLVGATLAISPFRRFLSRCLHVARVRRRWNRAVRDAGLASEDDRIPRARKIRSNPSGDQLAVCMPRGYCVPDLERRAEVVAAGLNVCTCA